MSGDSSETPGSFAPKQSATALFNDRVATQELAAALRRSLGEATVITGEPIMESEDCGPLLEPPARHPFSSG
jgi:hypothetical protein